MKKISIFIFALIFFTACKNAENNLPDGLYAEIETNKGTIITQLDFEKTPVTVANFVCLSEGKNPCVATQFKGKPFYDGLKFHRVIPNFMIQGGDPNGDGSGDAGYRFKDEINENCFTDGGVLAMANSGPATNGSQFFITHTATRWLDGRHTIFGHVVDNGMETVNSIEPNDEIVKVTIIRKGAAAKKFDAEKVFANNFVEEAKAREQQKKIDAENQRLYEIKFKPVIDKKLAEFAALRKASQKTASGLQYKIIASTGGKKPKPGSEIYIHYAGFLENGDLFDTSKASIAEQFGKLDIARAQAQQYIPIPFTAGKRDGMIPGFIEGIEKLSFGEKAIIFIPSHLGYGPQGAGGVIPPNANVIFEIELLEKMPNR